MDHDQDAMPVSHCMSTAAVLGGHESSSGIFPYGMGYLYHKMASCRYTISRVTATPFTLRAFVAHLDPRHFFELTFVNQPSRTLT